MCPKSEEVETTGEKQQGSELSKLPTPFNGGAARDPHKGAELSQPTVSHLLLPVYCLVFVLSAS